MKKLFLLLSMFLPWALRRAVLRRACGFDIHPTAAIAVAARAVAPTIQRLSGSVLAFGS